MACLNNITIHTSTAVFAVQTVGFALLEFVTVFGNLLVIVAILKYRNLRTVNGMFLVSLAVADLSLGVLVLPFSSVNEILQRWLFGSFWCQSWLIIDVLLCTSSIFNLVAISMDRYVAITRPLSYPTTVTKSRGRNVIILVWSMAFFVSFPPMVYPNVVHVQSTNVTVTIAPKCSCTPLNNSPGYILYSSMGSFFIPMIVIIIVYFRIFLIVRRVKKSMYRGYIVNGDTTNGQAGANGADIGLRVHRGSRKNTLSVAPMDGKKLLNLPSSRRLSNSGFDTPSLKASSDLTSKGPLHKDSCLSVNKCLAGPNPTSPGRRHSRRHSSCGGASIGSGSIISQDHFDGSIECIAPERGLMALRTTFMASAALTTTVVHDASEQRGSLLSLGSGSDEGSIRSPRIAGAVNKLFKTLRTRKKQKSTYRGRFLLELQAAKTVAIVTSCFVFCWIGFAVSYLLEAFGACSGNACIPENWASIVFWLGYLNSALNPIIYALFNKQFRVAFKRLLCRGSQRIKGRVNYRS